MHLKITTLIKPNKDPLKSICAGLALAFFPLMIMASPQATQGQSSANFYGDFSSDKLLQNYHFDRAIVPYGEFPFPDVPLGTMWEPSELPSMEVVTFVPDGARRWQPDWAKAVLDEADALVEAGNGQAAITLLSNANPPIPGGAAQRAIGNIYLAGQGGVETDREQGLLWIKRAAEYNPHLFQWLGSQQDDPDMRMHYWSRGLSRGCFECAGKLISATKAIPVDESASQSEDKKKRKRKRKSKKKDKVAETVPVKRVGPDLALRYALFATEIGDRRGPSLIRQVIDDARKNPDTVSEQTKALIAELESVKEGLPTAASYQLYSGLVPGRLKVAADLLEQGNHLDAGTALLFSDARGRNYEHVVNAVMERAPDGTFAPTVATTFAMRLTEWGDMRHAAAASIIEREGYKRFLWLHNKWSLFNPPHNQKVNYKRGYDARMHRADALMQLAKDSPMTPKGIVGAVSGDMAEKRATDCLNKAINQPNATNYGNATRINNCRRLVEQAWAASSATDFGVFSDDGFAGLLQDISNGCPECRAAAVQRHNAARDAQIRDREARLKRWDEGPGGRNTPIAQSQAEIMERAEARVDYINRGIAPRQTVAMGGGLTTDEARTYVALDRFYTAYREQVARVAAGYQAGNMEACSVWSYAVLPMCP